MYTFRLYGANKNLPSTTALAGAESYTVDGKTYKVVSDKIYEVGGDDGNTVIRRSGTQELQRLPSATYTQKFLILWKGFKVYILPLISAGLQMAGLALCIWQADKMNDDVQEAEKELAEASITIFLLNKG